MKKAASLLLLALLTPTLQGCFPVVAAGVGAGTLMASDRRTSGAYIEDESIENKSVSLVKKEYDKSVHVNITSFNRHVLLTGEVPTEAAKADIGRLAASVENVRGITNELTVGMQSSVSARSNDALITSNVKTRFIGDNRFHANDVKVITEANVVYLMGLVYRKEGDAAAEIASESKGVDRVVKVFEYMD